MPIDMLGVAVVLLLMGAPGVAFSFAFLKGIALNRVDKIFLGFLLGILLNPVLSIAEFIILQMPFSSIQVLANSVLILVVSLAIMLVQGQLRPDFSGLGKYFQRGYYRQLIEERPLAVAVYVLLLAIFCAAFYVRIASSWDSRFFEFDPFFYDSVTQQLVMRGSLPMKSDMSYYPRFRSYRELPLMHYMTGDWYALYRDFTAQAYDMDQLILIIQIYPPLLGAFLAYMAFIFIREESNKYVGLIAAAMFAFTPQLIKKLGAGVSEQAPFGMFAAMFVFAMYGLAINRKSYRLGVLAGFSAMVAYLGSAHAIWPFTILAAFIFITSFLEYFKGQFEERTFFINLIVASAAIISNLALLPFKGSTLSLQSMFIGNLFIIGALIPSALLFGVVRLGLDRRFSRRQILSGVILLLVAFSLVTPIAYTGIGYINSLLRIAKTDNPLNRTVQEENATSEGLFASSFGVLNPNQLLLLSTVLVVVLAVVALRRKGIYYSAGFGTLAFILIALNAQIDLVFSAFAGALNSSLPEVARLLRFAIDSDVFIYLLISIISICIYYLYEEKKSNMFLLFLLAFFPTAYIGLNKVKYLLHLAFALALALPFVLMMFSELFERLNSAFNLVKNERALKISLLVLVMLVGAVASYKQLETVPQSMAELQYSRITSDWIDATNWMRSNLGANSRVSSWWDYGHWTTFLGGTRTVLDPSNYYSDYDQLTARGYVGGNTSLLIDILHYHNATHVLMDSELVQKWGALVYLSGTFSGLTDDPKFNYLKQEIPFSNVPGQSEYESTHYFEYIYAVYRPGADGNPAAFNCPGVITKQMLYSSFGVLYCIDPQGNMNVFNPNGEGAQVKDPRFVRADDSQLALAPLGSNSDLYYNQRYMFINLNPDLNTLTNGRLNSTLYNSAFVQLYFLEKLDGFKLVYKSPNSQVKIFELIA
ncbi:MAG TPA: STT3 domain-containing protein [Candidatus Norongarragalinales archaeon]|nr:STT3 domain-containing protein [Candidatus Norongarragalinales archaeon]